MPIQVELQYLHGCPNSRELLKRVKVAVKSAQFPVDFQETLVETSEVAVSTAFRGSPTLLINGEDYEGLPAPENAYLSCRIYDGGIPTSEELISRLRKSQSE